MGMGISGVIAGLRKNPAGRASYDSLIEKRYMEMLEEDPTVRTWTKEHGIKIRYPFFFVRKTYRPDFLVTLKDGSKEIHETKGDGLMYWLTTHAKREAAEQWCKEHGCIYRLVTPAKEWFYASPTERERR